MWDYSNSEPEPYGDELTYRLGMDLLADCEVVEDWGCGFAWAKQYRKGTYVGIDASPGYADVVADLRDYTSDVDGIFCRHVLEHVEEWWRVLDNAIASAPRLVLILFTPMADATHYLYRGEHHVDLGFAASDIVERFDGRPWSFADYKTETQYGVERIYSVG